MKRQPLHDPSRGACPHRNGPYRKAWIRGWWAHYYRQPNVPPIWMYPGYISTWQAGWQFFHDTHHFMAHAAGPVTGGDRRP